MKKIILAVLLTASCSGGPLVTHSELEDTVKSLDSRMDSSNQWVIDAITNLLRSMFPDHSSQIPSIQLDKPPPTVPAVHDDGMDWKAFEIWLASLLGTGGAVGLRYLDHRRKALQAAKKAEEKAA
jgi:hypothetical protein